MKKMKAVLQTILLQISNKTVWNTVSGLYMFFYIFLTYSHNKDDKHPSRLLGDKGI